MSGDPRALLREAQALQKKAESGGVMSGFFSSSKEDKWQAAVEKYNLAANAFLDDAGATFKLIADIQKNKLNEPDDAATSLQSAFNAFRLTQPAEAVRCMEQVIERYTARGNFRRAAAQVQTLAELQEEQGMMKEALDSYEKAGKWFQGDNAPTLANKNFLKVAEIAALKQDPKADDRYLLSIKHFEGVAKSSLSNAAMKWSVKDYFLKAGLCHLARGDMVDTNRAFQEYLQMDPTFGSQKEYQLLMDLAGAIQEGDQDAFGDKLFLYDKVNTLDSWKITMCRRIKDSIEEVGEDFS
ncbi:hypothetical protein BP6252_03486 [Coleophoma cylindrospora]|uniref:Vesicular-fusion protein sec17 n=1 Tax=Coleophoma cylindrospora TaxID=1849047 RepID=A0A3D8S8G0_9HELO|nr:hypothetical protein BP6252_03486 [Coleophoma cylindrospora]